MEFEPKSEQDLWEETLLPAGEYDFEVSSAEAKQSKARNDMIELKINVFPADGGNPRKVKDWLMAKMGFKLRHFCYATGLEQAYEEGTLTDINCQAVSGRLKLGIQDSDYGKQNSVKDYVVSSTEPNPDDLPNDDPPPPLGVPAGQTKRAQKAAAATGEDDDIPF